MPTYEYRCPEGHTFDVFQKMSDEPVAECPECGRQSERQLSAGAGLLFKGEGFYITDYRSDAYRKAAEKESKASSGGGKDGSGGAGAGKGGSAGDGAGKSGAGSGSDGGASSGSSSSDA